MSYKKLFSNYDEIGLILIGSMGSGKSKVGTCFLSPSDGFNFTVSTTASEMKLTTRLGKTLRLVDTPGLNSLQDNNLIDELNKSLSYSSPGPHLFLFCVSMARNTENFGKIISLYLDTFGRNVTKYILFVFTHFDQWLEDMTEKEVINPDFINDYRKCLPLELRKFMESCGNEYTIFDTSKTNKAMAADNILQSAMTVIERNNFASFRKTRLKRFKDMCCRVLRELCHICRRVWNVIVNGQFHQLTNRI